MADDPEVHTTTAAIVVNYDGGRLLHRCLESVLSQEPAPDEVLVVDNASTDGSTEGLPEGVRLVRRPHNDGYGAAVATGLAETRGAFVWLLNPDTVMQPGCHGAAVAALDADPAAGAVAPLVLKAADPARVDASGIGLTSHFGQINVDHDLLASDLDQRARPVLGPLGGASLWRRAAIERAGGFPTWYFLYWEDMDMALRLARAGYTCMTAPAAQVLHEGGGTVGHLSPLNVYHMTRNHWACLVAAAPGRLLARHPLRALLAPLRATVLYALRGRALSACAGLVVGLTLLPRAWRNRLKPEHLADARQTTERLEALMQAADADRLRMRRAAAEARA